MLRAISLVVAALLSAPTGVGAAQPALRVVVCDSHHHVLRHWIEAAAEGLLPRSQVTVVHFDAHPDLAVPERFVEKAWPARPGALVSAVDIASFQLAAAWIGLVDRVVWLRPPWATQLPDGERRMRLGEVAGNRLRVDDPSDYYVLDESWAPGTTLADPVELALLVAPLPDVDPGVSLHTGAAVFDVDLDGFATRNPGADAMRRAGLTDAEIELVRDGFARERLDLPEDPAARADTLASILAAVEAIADGGVLEQLSAAFELWWLGVPAGTLFELYGVVGDASRPGAADALREWGRDVVGLPERRTAADGGRETAARLAALLGSGAVRPSLVTIARSANDGFTPMHEWAAYETALLGALAEVRRLDVRYDRGLEPAAPR